MNCPTPVMGLSVLAIASLGYTFIALAAPASVFSSVLEEIRHQLPRGASIRLPSYLPPSPTGLYPYIESDHNGFRVNLAFKPNCRKACTVGGLGLLPNNVWPPTDSNRTRLTLKHGLQGYALTRGQGPGKTYYVFWQQDGQTYGIGANALAVSQQQLAEIARSMANEPPIRSAKSGNN